LPSYGHVNEAKTGICQLRKCRPTQVDSSTFLKQTLGGAAVGDFDNHASIRMRDYDLRAEGEKPRCGGESVWIEPLAIGHQ
jgi:hypothetical protein